MRSNRTTLALFTVFAVLLLCLSGAAQKVTPPRDNGGNPLPVLARCPTLYSMSISFSSYTIGSNWPGTTINVNYPTNHSGQTMVATVGVDNADDPFGGNPVCTAPGGWTLVKDNGAFGVGVYSAVWVKLGDGSTGATTWSFNVNIRGQVVILCYDDTDQVTPIESGASFHNDASLSSVHTASSITTTLNNSLVVGCFFLYDTNSSFNDIADLPNTRVSLVGISAVRPLLVADAIQLTAGASGSKAAESNRAGFGQEILFAIRPSPNPSGAAMTYTNGGEQLTAGATVSLTCTQATSPTAAQSSLKYEFSYTINGVDYTALALSAAGTPSKALTVPATLTSLFKARVRSYDPAIPAYSATYDYSDGYSSIIAEAAPPQPIVTTPTSGAVVNKAVVTPINLTYGGGAGNPLTETTWLWSRDNFASHTSSPIVVSGSDPATTIDFSGEAVGATISLKGKTKGLSLYSVYSAVRQFIVASVPATPNITAPTAASPPTVPKPTHTFTESDTFVSRRLRITELGAQVYDTGVVSSSALSFVLGAYSYKPSILTVIYLSVGNAYGLFSAEDSETFTPSFTPPAIPTVTASAVNSTLTGGGYIELQIANSDTPDSNEIWRYPVNTTDALLLANGDYFLLPDGSRLLLPDDRSAAIRIAQGVAVDGTYQDHDIASGLRYNYFARAVITATDLTADSSPVKAGVTLSMLHLHAVDKASGSSNAANPVALLNQPPMSLDQDKKQALTRLAGRGIGAGAGTITGRMMNAGSVTIPYNDQTKFDSFMASYRSTSMLCMRDQMGNLLFGRAANLRTKKGEAAYELAFDLIESEFQESI